MSITDIIMIIITSSSLITALSILYGKFIRPIKRIIKQVDENKEQIEDLEDKLAILKISRNSDNEFSTEIRAMLLESLIAVLDGLEQTGANHLVTEQKQKLITFLTKQV